MAPKWSAEEWRRFDAERKCGGGGQTPGGGAAAGKGKAGGVPGADPGSGAAGAASGDGRRRRHRGVAGASLPDSARYGGHAAEFFARQLASVQRQEQAHGDPLKKLLEGGRCGPGSPADACPFSVRGRGDVRAAHPPPRSSTPLSSTGGDTAAPGDGAVSMAAVEAVCSDSGATSAAAPAGASDGVPAVAVPLSPEEWRDRHGKLCSALEGARNARSSAAVQALEAEVQALGPEPTPAKTPLSPWTVAQRARLHCAKVSRQHAAAVAAKEQAHRCAEEASATLRQAEEELSRLSALLAAARGQECEAFVALQAAKQEGGPACGASTPVTSTSSPLQPTSSPLAPVLQALADDGVGKVSDHQVAGALEVVRLALARKAAPPRKAAWADADAIDAGSGDELDDAWADGVAACKRSCPDSELNAAGARDEASDGRSGDAGWASRRTRCRRSASGARARSADDATASPLAARHAGSSRSRCRGETPAVAELRRTVGTVKVAVAAPAFAAALPSACGQLMGALQGNVAAGASAAPQHPVFVAADGRTHASC